ncbi:uncharacterized protein LOC126267955 [Schistocerca gregaria]|uniref:uncharacterized protein LOC126267955 n=1 Tax=Schistocerca gregaria TaxID=7010 RepID=UPI00211EEC58|nr:uncharacterized protein LOC126267955 [Schistocerca gregaria]
MESLVHPELLFTSRIILHLPVKVKGKQLSKLKKGDMKAFENAVAVILAWKDKRPVIMESTHHKDAMQEITQRKQGGSEEVIQKPSVICDYTANMGAETEPVTTACCTILPENPSNGGGKFSSGYSRWRSSVLTCYMSS